MASRKKRKLSQIEGDPAEEQEPDPADLHYLDHLGYLKKVLVGSR